MEYSPQQQDIFSWVEFGRGSAFVQARAGTGKTTLLVGACQLMGGSIAFAAYNTKIAREIKGKLEEAGVSNNQLRAGTFHSFGLAGWRRAHPQVKISEDNEKRDRINEELKVPEQLQSFAHKLAGLAKQAGMGLLCDPNDQHAWWGIVDHHDLAEDLEDPEWALDGVRQAYRVLKASRGMARELIDFDDMIYMPVVSPVRLWQNDWVLVDEAQDTNPARRALARKMLRPGGRAVWVGDEKQSIYGFTGADSEAVDIIRKEFGCATFPLTVTYRCPKSVVALAQTIVPDIKAHESAPEGVVRDIVEAELPLQNLGVYDAILCRKTAPLLKTAFQLIKLGTACHVEGREIGAGLLKLATRWKVKTMLALGKRLDEYLEREVSKLMAKGRETAAEAVRDRVDTLKVLMENCADLSCLKTKIETMFADDAPTLTLSTVHKSKGREWDRVFILGYHQYMPSKYARQEWQLAQEFNLCYVAITRAKRELVMVNVPPAAA